MIAVLVVIAAIVIMVIALVATSLKKLSSDQGRLKLVNFLRLKDLQHIIRKSMFLSYFGEVIRK